MRTVTVCGQMRIDDLMRSARSSTQTRIERSKGVFIPMTDPFWPHGVARVKADGSNCCIERLG